MNRLLVILILLPRLAFAGGTNAVNQQAGLAFIQSMAPTTNGQIVNPANATSPAWSGQTGVPATTPTGLGAFSGQPNTTIYGNAQALGLSAIGNNAQINCVNYTPGQNPYQDQACAAVNFLNNQCIQPNNQDAKILQNTGTASQINPACNGTYGQGAAQFNYQNTLNSSDSMFATIAGLKQTANAAQGACGVQTTTTTPAQNQTVTCVTSTNTTDNTCSEYLNVSVLTSDTPASVQTSCTSGVLVGQYCQATTSSAANQSYDCPANYTLVNNTCNETLTQGASSSYSCANGYTLSGTSCTKQITTTSNVCSMQSPQLTGSLNGGYYDSFLTTSCNGASGFSIVTGGMVWLDPKYYGWDVTGEDSIGYKYYVNGYAVNTPATINVTIGSATSGTATATFNYGGSVTTYNYSYNYDGNSIFTLIVSHSCPYFFCWYVPPPQTIQITLPVTQSTQTISDIQPAVPSYSCPSGYTLSGQSCVQNNSQPAISQFNCPNGSTLTGTQCVTTTTMPPNVTYSCSDGSAPQNGMCIMHTVQTSWTDTCSTYEQNAGITLNP